MKNRFAVQITPLGESEGATVAERQTLASWISNGQNSSRLKRRIPTAMNTGMRMSVETSGSHE